MKSDKQSQTERIGVSAVNLKFARLGVIFREQMVEDYGIDAHIEIVENERATGRLIALQIKSGESYFKESNDKGITFRGELSHLQYWTCNSLPVLIILYDDSTETAYWQNVSEHNIQRTQKAWKITIPWEQKIDYDSINEIKEFAIQQASANDYVIVRLGDASHANAKRYSANILLNKQKFKPELRQLICVITDQLKTREYYRNKQIQQRWKGKTAQVIWLFIYLSSEDIQTNNWICSSQWIDKNLSPEYSPIKSSGEEFESIIINWNENYQEKASFYNSLLITKEDYLESIEKLFAEIQLSVYAILRCYEKFTLSEISEKEYMQHLKDLEDILAELSRNVANVGIPPVECQDLNTQFQSLVIYAHNSVLPFSENGLRIWDQNTREWLKKEAIKDYYKVLQKFEFELEKLVG